MLDPVVLDAAGQVIGFWTAEHLDRGRVDLPVPRSTRSTSSGRQRPAGEALTCSAAIELVGDQLVRSDIDVVGGDGEPWMRLTGWEDKRFDVPAQFRSLTRVADRRADLGASGPSRRPSSAARVLPVPAAHGAAARPRLLEARVGAPRALRRAERERVPCAAAAGAARARVAGRAHGGEGGRASRSRRSTPASSCFPRTSRSGRTRRVGRSSAAPWLADAGLAPVVSLAHSNGAAVALAGLEGRVGIDLERLPAANAATSQQSRSRRPSGSCSSSCPSDIRDEWELRLWCAKEAVGKALGTGLTRGPQGLAVTALDPGHGAHPGASSVTRWRADHRELATAPLVVHSLRQDDFVVATTLCEQEVSDDDPA